MYENIHSFTKEGFTIVFSVTPEDNAPDWFESEDERKQFWYDIEHGYTSWFIAKVEAYKNDIRLGVDYLGGCCYPSPMDFVKDSDYFADMVSSVIGQSKAMIKALTKE